MSVDMEALREQKEREYGNAVNTHEKIASAWSALLADKLAANITPAEVAWMMVMLKAIRSVHRPDLPDSYDDGENYVSIARDCALGESEGRYYCADPR